MNIGIITYSQTGNTYAVAQRLKEKLSSVGHFVEIERLSPVDEIYPGARNIQLEKMPDIDKYDSIIFASPVQGFTLAVPMTVYLKQLKSLKGKQISCFVTQFLPYAWMGGKQAISKIKKICEEKGAFICEKGVINWSSKKLKRQISELIDRFIIFFGVIEQTKEKCYS